MPRLKYTKELLEEAVPKVDTFAALCRYFGIKPYTGAQTNIAKRVRAYQIDTSHFLGQAHNRGKTFDKTPLENYLVVNSTMKSSLMRTRLIAEGYKAYRCEICYGTEWGGQPIPLELDHINSDHWDCRIENLQILCPNCHAVETQKRRNPSPRIPTAEEARLERVQ